MAHSCSEDQLVEQPAIGLLAELGCTTVSALEEVLTLRRTRDLLLPRLLSGRVNLASAKQIVQDAESKR